MSFLILQKVNNKIKKKINTNHDLKFKTVEMKDTQAQFFL